MLALIDGDILVYRIGFTTEDVDFNIAAWRMDELLKDILEAVQATEFQIYLTASNDTTAFRKQVYPEYKGNRKAPRPVHYEKLREYLVAVHGASISTTIEADDAIGIDSRNTPNCIIVSIDKDLLQIPGKHYNFVKREFKEVNEYEGLYFFYKQLLMGDKADNIKGIDGIGEKKAERILNTAEDFTEEEWFRVVREAYGNDAEMLMNGECLWILQKPFPQGTFSSHRLGLTLLPEEVNVQSCSQRQNEDSLEYGTLETSTDGRCVNGTNPLENTNPLEEVHLST